MKTEGGFLWNRDPGLIVNAAVSVAVNSIPVFSSSGRENDFSITGDFSKAWKPSGERAHLASLITQEHEQRSPALEQERPVYFCCSFY